MYPIFRQTSTNVPMTMEDARRSVPTFQAHWNAAVMTVTYLTVQIASVSVNNQYKSPAVQNSIAPYQTVKTISYMVSLRPRPTEYEQ